MRKILPIILMPIFVGCASNEQVYTAEGVPYHVEAHTKSVDGRYQTKLKVGSYSDEIFTSHKPILLCENQDFESDGKDDVFHVIAQNDTTYEWVFELESGKLKYPPMKIVSCESD